MAKRNSVKQAGADARANIESVLNGLVESVMADLNRTRLNRNAYRRSLKALLRFLRQNGIAVPYLVWRKSWYATE